MLGVVFDRLATSLVEGMRVLSRTPTTFAIEGLATGGLFEALTLARGSVGAVLHSPELDCRALLTFDRGLRLLADPGPARRRRLRPRRSPGPAVHENRARARPAGRRTDGALASQRARRRRLGHLHSGAPGTDRRHVDPRPARSRGRDRRFRDPWTRAAGHVTVALPQTALQPIRQKLSRDLSNDATTSDPQWTRQMQDGISSAEIIVRASSRKSR